ncbi:MAG: hypothetical protein FWE27_08190 [Defluviitaleaceae bacterium]|nr:hypothetical protein [Defluviitaleaceae bacterium]
MESKCWGCGKPIELEGTVYLYRCPECREKLEKENGIVCSHCGALRSKSNDAARCSSCDRI